MDSKLAGRGEKFLPPFLLIYTDFLNSAVHLENTEMEVGGIQPAPSEE